MKTKSYIFSIFSTLFFYLSVLLIIIGFNFSDTPPPGPFWYQQFITGIGNRSISDITFVDSLTGYAITTRLSSADTSFILKTTNGGDAWFTNRADRGVIFTRVQFINQSTGFVGGSIVVNSLYYILKTTNAGLSWFYINAPFQSTYQADMSVLNVDTIWTVEDESLTGGVFRTTNGGVSWQQQPVPNMDHIYMFNRNIGFVTNTQVANYEIYKTTDSGLSWNLLIDGESFVDMHFIDSLTGWRAWGSGARKTTDGGLTWQYQPLPAGGNIVVTEMNEFSVLNPDTLWGVGGSMFYGAGQFRAMIYRTLNGGINWQFQIPDTSIHFFRYYHSKFVSKNNGWAYSTLNGIHTTKGGDTTWYVGIQQISSEVPQNYELKQNYPNPFNPRTVIPYSLKKSAYVRMIAYDILGREAQILVDQIQQAGEYEVDFMGKFAASGVYFYQMTISNEQSSEVFKETKKMILIK